MNHSKDPRDIKGQSIDCAGDLSAPHDPVRLDVPEDRTIQCPVCGTLYRRASGWAATTGASWPKPR